ncbi:MAG: hypothetical protein NTW96_23255, partial [Planctomycetia bacterium]|nr:hypothetical protein [Planctomycetia bacterium]
MADNRIGEQERELAERLRREAEASRPAFSEALHSRFVEAIRERAAQTGVERPAGLLRRRPAYVGAVAACAAACLVVATLVVLRRAESPGPTPETPTTTALAHPSPDPLAGLDALADVSNTAATDVGALVDSTLARKQWAYLDH